MGKLRATASVAGGLMVSIAVFAASFYYEGWAHAHSHVTFWLMVFSMLGAVLCYTFLIFSKTDGKRPKIALTAQNGEPFTLVHLGGGAAQHIQIEPIQSALGKNIWVRFGAVDFLGVAKPEVCPSFRLYLHGIPKENNGMGLLGAALFSGDAMGRETVDYPVNISFHWNGKRFNERQTLTWHYATKRLTTGVAK